MEDIPVWEILDKYFVQSGDTDCPNRLVAHQIESMNEFLDKKLIQIIQGFNPIQICHNYSVELKDFRHKINLIVLNPSIAKPMFQQTDGTQVLMTPHLARMNNLTYVSNLYVDIRIVTETINDDNVIERKESLFRSICIGKLPIMTRSKACVLSQMPMLAEEQGKHECRYDLGGYFIVNGNEKVIISQDRISENKTLVFAPNGNGDGLYAEIRSMPDGTFLPPKTCSLCMSGKSNHAGNVIRLNASFLRSDVPLFVMFRALGIESDKEIFAHVVYDLDDEKNQRMLNQLIACAEDACDIHTQDDALAVLLKILGTTGTPREYIEQPSKAIEILKTTIRNDFLSHTGSSFKKKALYLGYMVRKMLSIHLGYQDYDNRDSYFNKRIDTPGILFGNLFRQCYGKLIKDVRNLIVRELNLWRANPNSNTQIISENNIHRFFKQSVIETGLRYALSTGNWGVKSIGSFQNIRQGVAQVLNRMSYLSTLSHMRRINTPMEKNGKLVQPRKLENTQIGMVCAAECFDPETPILMWNGTIKKARDIIVGDYLIDDNGNSIRVKSTCSGTKMMYEIIPTKKNFMRYTVTDNHILTLKARNHVRNPTGKNKNYSFRYFDVKEMRYIAKSFDHKEDLEEFKSKVDDVIDITIEKYLSLPVNVQKELYTFKSNGINWESKEVSLDPYILGMWLGDGFSCGYGFATADKELLDKWIEWGKDNDATITKGTKYKYNISSTINKTQPGIACNKTEEAPLAKLLRVYNLVKNKHIPLDYIVNDRKTRLAVLAGIIDTDGHVRANGHEIRITQGEKNYKIIYDTEFLARSLGFSCHLNDGTCTYSVNGEKRQKPYKELTITGEYLYEIPTVLARKKLNEFDNPTTIKKCSSYLQSRFELLKKDEQPFVGWQVEGTGRFLIGDLSVVHNTPEGSAVGLVKNMALSSGITNNISSVYVRKVIEELGTIMYSDDITDILSYLKEMGSDDAVHIMINGDLVGYHLEPETFYNEMKHKKRYGSIPVTTAIIWDIQKRVISMSTEAGRMYRPLMIVNESGNLRLKDLMKNCGKRWDKDFSTKSFQQYVAPLVDDYSEGFIEYMDTEEIDKAMVAMNPTYLEKPAKGISQPPIYTHCEIHPSLHNGILAANIPFPDHNQAPRNCYQCLWLEENVRMSDGTLKPIKNVMVGDSVTCFDTTRMITYNTKVIHQYVRPTDKPIFKITTLSGRNIIATQDHKFMTPNGWMEIAKMNLNEVTKVGILVDSPAYSNVVMNTFNIIDDTVTISDELKTLLQSKNMYPLTNTNVNMSIIVRLVGYIIGRGRIGFNSIDDNNQYKDDVQYLGFVDERDNLFIEFSQIMTFNGNTVIGTWIRSCSDMVQCEYISGYLGGYGNTNLRFADLSYNIDSTKVIIKYNIELAKQRIIDIEYARHVEYYTTIYPSTTTKEPEKIPYMKNDFTFLVTLQGNMIFVPLDKKDMTRNVIISDITVESDYHSFIGGDGFAVSNSAMGKQAVGTYMSNFNHRVDTMAHIMHYPQKAIVRTKLSKYTFADELAAGINSVVAIATYTGFNQEDSVMVNQSAVDRGFMTSTYLKSYRDQCSKNHSTGQEEIFAKPDIDTSTRTNPFNYDKLGEDGMVPKNTYVDSNDILVGKIMPHKVGGVVQHRDSSLQMKGNDEGYVDYTHVGINGEGYKYCKVRLRKYRKPAIGDKAACLGKNHTIMVRGGEFKNFEDLKPTDEVAVLVDGKIRYEIPEAYHHYPNYKGKMYHISNQAIDLDVTHNHRMWVSKRAHEKVGYKYKDVWTKYDFEFAENLVGKRVKYKKDAEWEADDYQFVLPEVRTATMYFVEKDVDMDAWLTFFGIWIAEGWVDKKGYGITFAAHKPRVQLALTEVIPKLGHEYKFNKNYVHFSNAQINSYLRQFGKAIDKFLPPWVYELSKRQAHILIEGMMLGDGHRSATSQNYYTSSAKLAENFQCLCIHAGYAADIKTRSEAGSFTTKKDGSVIKTNADALVVSIHYKRINPTVNHGHTKTQEIQEEYMYDYEGPVYCLTVSSGVFMVKKNGKAVWTGNSKNAQKGTIGMLYKEQDMPFTKDGIRPDIIMNPHAIPSRMTMGQLMECIMAKAGCYIGARGDCTPFNECTVEDIAKVLEVSGYERYGNEILYCGKTGKQIDTEIFIGPTYYQRLKHMSADKNHCTRSDHDVLTEKGWKNITLITLKDKVATLNSNNKIIYEHPTAVLEFPDFKGQMYHICNDGIDLDVTSNHRMYVSFDKDYELIEASQLYGKSVKYKKTGEYDNKYRNQLDKTVYVVDTQKEADIIQIMAIESGWYADIKKIDNKYEINVNKVDDCVITNNNTKEEVYDYEGPVYCLQVPNEVFMVRRNGKAVWTGNSRGSNGPIVMLTRQPAEGRARNGGLRFGEMERDAIVAHGASAFLKERVLDVSDNFRVFVCRKCGLICTGNPDKQIFKCSNCKNGTDIVQVRIPYAMKLLMQELMSMSVAPRMVI